MSQNTSSAVMAQRVEAHDSLDDFPTPPWATRALIKHVLFPYLGGFAPDQQVARMRCWEPACNRGYMARPLVEYFKRVWTSDVADYGWDGQENVSDFLWPGSESSNMGACGI